MEPHPRPPEPVCTPLYPLFHHSLAPNGDHPPRLLARSRSIPRPLSLSDNVTWPEANGLLAASDDGGRAEG